MASSFHVVVGDMAGRAHQITGLSPSDPFAVVLDKVRKEVDQSKNNALNEIQLVDESRILSHAQRHETLCTLGIVEGMHFTVINVHAAVHELHGKGSSARVSFDVWGRCLLITVTTGRDHIGDILKSWVVCYGTYHEEGEANICSWDQQFKLTRTGNILVKDSGWGRVRAKTRVDKIVCSEWYEQRVTEEVSNSANHLLGMRIDGYRGHGEEVLKLLGICSSI